MEDFPPVLETPEPETFDPFRDAALSDITPRLLLRQQFDTAVFNHSQLNAELAEAMDNASQAMFDLAAIQDELNDEETKFKMLLRQSFHMVRKRPDIIQDVMEYGHAGSQLAWEAEWCRDWIPGDEEHDFFLKDLIKNRRKKVARHRFVDAYV